MHMIFFFHVFLIGQRQKFNLEVKKHSGHDGDMMNEACLACRAYDICQGLRFSSQLRDYLVVWGLICGLQVLEHCFEIRSFRKSMQKPRRTKILSVVIRQPGTIWE